VIGYVAAIGLAFLFVEVSSSGASSCWSAP
jgi:hypothetical protein